MQSNRIEMHYYTYAYLREDKTPYYIGKGKGDRIYSKQKYIKPPKDKSRIIYLKQNLTEEEAFRHEIYMIDVFGRKDLGTGILQNLTDGGEGSSGAVRSDEYRRKLSNTNKGRNVSEKTRKKISESTKGKSRSEEHRKNIGKANKNKIVSEETRKKISEAGTGRPCSEETRRKHRENMKGRKWWNDGCGNRKFVLECPGDSWKPGRK